MDATKRSDILAAPVVALALGTIGYGIYHLVESPPESWTLVLAVIASVIICGPFQMHIGRAPGSRSSR
jgi:cobalamin synthase